MKYKTVFDIIGPVMIGPSSSHTAGAARIGRVARQLFNKQPKKVVVSLYESFAKTYKGHGTDVAIVGGLLDFDTDDLRLPQSLELAKEAGMEVTFVEEEATSPHPNTAKLLLMDGEDELEVVGISIGGGKMEIIELNGFELKLTGSNPALVILHHDRYGAVANVTKTLAENEVNIGHMEVARKEKGKKAIMIIESDELVSDALIEEIQTLPNILQVTTIEN
jgi:L-serine dehydratase